MRFFIFVVLLLAALPWQCQTAPTAKAATTALKKAMFKKERSLLTAALASATDVEGVSPSLLSDANSMLKTLGVAVS